MDIYKNTCRGHGLPAGADVADGQIETDPSTASALYAKCPKASETPLIDATGLARTFGIAKLSIKDERERMGLGSFKALGAAFAVTKKASAAMAAKGQALTAETAPPALSGNTFVCASAGNHGLSLAAGANAFGARAIVYIAETVPEDFARRLRERGADVVRSGAQYEASMEAAMTAARENGWQLLPDSTWEGCTEPARDVMEGYLVMGEEIARQCAAPPTHIFLQAGVGGLAAAAAASARSTWGADPVITVVEPEFAPALVESVKAGKPVTTAGPVSAMGRLDCKEPSHLALKYLAKEADYFVTITEDEADETVALLNEAGLPTTASGGAGISGLHHASKIAGALGLTPQSRVLVYLSEGPEDA